MDFLRPILLENCGESFKTMLGEALDKDKAKNTEKKQKLQAPVDSMISFRQLRGTNTLSSISIDIDDGSDLTKATGAAGRSEADFSSRLNHMHQLSGLGDPVYAEAYVTVHDYDIVLEILVINRTPNTLANLTVELGVMGDLKIVERPQAHTIGPLDQRTIKANIKVASVETGHIFGTIIYEEIDSETGEKRSGLVNLNDIQLDIMDYIEPATCTDTEFRNMWAEFEWENKVAVNTSMTDVTGFLNHIIKSTNMSCMTPLSDMGDHSVFLAANLYAKSIFGEDALVNVSVEKQEDGKIAGYFRIRSQTQGIALSLGNRIQAVQQAG